MDQFDFKSVVRGFHVYRVYWTPVVGEKLECELDSDGFKFGDRHAVSVMRNNFTVGHVPKEFSQMAHFFILHDGVIECEITGTRQRSKLARGGLEVPCVYVFRTDKPKLMSKLRELLGSMTK
jgi:hypothetical protein